MSGPDFLLLAFFDDIAVGQRVELGTYTFSADAIKSYAQRFDPQPFHLDEAAAKHTQFGALIASGWHTATMWMRLMLDERRRGIEQRRARGEAVPTLGPSPGFRDLRWLKPVYAGDTLSYVGEVIAVRPSNSRPRWGLVTLHNSATNQRGEVVLSWASTVFIERRFA